MVVVKRTELMMVQNGFAILDIRLSSLSFVSVQHPLLSRLLVWMRRIELELDII